MIDNTQPLALWLAEEISGIHCHTESEARAIAVAADSLCSQHARIAELEARIKTMAEEHADELTVAHLDGRMRAAQQPTPTPQADSQPASTYSIDADTQGIRARVADAITGALAFGAQGAQPPPTGHWLAPFWEMAREEVIRASSAQADSVTAPAAGAVAGPTSGLHPEKCPITGRPFFMTLDHPELGRVPTYGGPYDSYTIPAPEGEPTDPWHERELRSERYDHDAGWWVEGGEPIPLRIVHEDVLFKLQEDAEAAAAPTAPAQTADSVLEDAARLTYEQAHAIRQGHEIAASDGYFEARPQIDSNDRRKVFQAGFERGWGRHAALVGAQQPGAAYAELPEMPQFPAHPESMVMDWSALEIRVIAQYGRDMYEAGKRASHGQAPAQAAPVCGSPADLPPLPDPDLRDVGTTPGGIKEFLRGYATEYAKAALAARAPAGSVTAPAGGAVSAPVFAFRRKGLDDFCTCTEERYAELSAKPNLFETRIFYTTPPAQAADSVPEDAARLEFEMQHGSAIAAARKQGANHG